MKGTLYSADFIKTSDNGIRLLELNTDTSFLNNQVDDFDFREIHAQLSSSNLDEVHVIYKQYHKYFVDVFSQSLHDSCSISTFNKTFESTHTIYPTDVADSDTKFILRCAYNESAIFDSEYCKESIGLYKLMVDGTTDYTQSVVEFYYSSSEDDEEHDYLKRGHVNSNSVIPDYITKNTLESEEGSKLKFYKLNSSSTGSYTDKSNDFINDIKSEGKLVVPYYDTTDGGTHVKSIRSINVLFGASLENINLFTSEVSASFDIPTTESFQSPTGSELYKIFPQKHYYEFATNTFKFDWRNQGGIAPFENIQSGSESVSVQDAVVGDSYTSVRIASLPDTDNINELLSWSLDGTLSNDDTETTSSVLISKKSEENVFGVYTEIEFESSSLLTGPSLPILIYDSGSNKTRYEYVSNLDTDNHSIYKLDGTLQSIDELNFYVTSEPTSSTVELNFEEDDTFIINDMGVKLISHNIYYYQGKSDAFSGCFIAGTEITLADGDVKNIEDVVVGEEVLTYNEESGKQESGVVGDLKQHEVNSVIRLTLDNENIIITTKEHPFFVEGKGWVNAGELQSLDVCKKVDGKESLISTVEVLEETHTVYNLLSVSENHNFYADGILVHNKV